MPQLQDKVVEKSLQLFGSIVLVVEYAPVESHSGRINHVHRGSIHPLQLS
jgi:hypothetical protein